MYLVLPSNSSSNYYPNNTVANFKTRLPKDVVLESGEWEVALEEIQYVHSWNSFSNPVYFTLNYPHEDTKKFHLPPGYYLHRGAIAEEISDIVSHLPDFQMDLTITWNSHTDCVTLTTRNELMFCMNEWLAKALGFEVACLKPNVSHISVRNGLTLNTRALYVYCDIVSPRFVGDAYVPLLRVVGDNGHRGRNVCQSFVRPQYVPIVRNTFHDIEIDIRDDTGKQIPFIGGRVVVTLHFRRRPPM